MPGNEENFICEKQDNHSKLASMIPRLLHGMCNFYYP